MKRPNDIAPALLVSDQELVGAEFSLLQRLVEQGVGRPAKDGDASKPKPPMAIALDPSRSPAAGGLRTYLPEETGTGYWDFVQVVPGIYTGITDASYRRPHCLELPEETLTKIRILCSGCLWLIDSGKTIDAGSVHIHSLRREQARRFAYEIHTGELRMVTLHLTPEGLAGLGMDGKALHDFVAREHAAGDAAAPVRRIEPADRLLRIAEAILLSRDRFPGAFRLTYVTGKARELLTEALSALFSEGSDSRATPGPRETRLRRRLQEAQRIIDATLADPPIIEQLARMVGINRTTLKAEFKAAFGTTIHQYQAAKRMREARRLIEETALPMGAIAEQLGFSQASQLSSAVRRHYGTTPRALRHNYRNSG